MQSANLSIFEKKQYFGDMIAILQRFAIVAILEVRGVDIVIVAPADIRIINRLHLGTLRNVVLHWRAFPCRR